MFMIVVLLLLRVDVRMSRQAQLDNSYEVNVDKLWGEIKSM